LDQLIKQEPYPEPIRSIANTVNCQMDVLPDYGQVGYIIQPDGSTSNFKGALEGYRLFLTQFLIAPRFINTTVENRWIIANFTNAEEIDQAVTLLNARLARQCGQNSAVLERVNYP
jgi:hypothetical protein